MDYIEKFREGSLSILEKIYSHPFVKELASGTLEQEKFVFYLQQDWLYLNEFSQALAGAALLAPNAAQASSLIKFSHEVNICEQELHLSFFKEYKVPKSNILSPACFNYTNFLRATVSRGNYAAALVGLLPCFSVYRDVGTYIFKISHSGNPYKDWINTYSSEEFSKSVDEMVSLIRQEIRDKPLMEIDNLLNLYKISAHFEFEFWDDAYFLRELFPKKELVQG
jgi:thiaminase/transcriptional activator TenA